MRGAAWHFFFALGLVLFQLLSCGVKSPPFLPEREFPLVVTKLAGEWENGVVRLSGNVVSRSGNAANASDVVGCRVYHAGYDLEAPPCDGCPIDFEGFEEIAGPVVEDDRFRCEVSGIDKRGIHYFKVRLLGRKGAVGPSSNVAKIVVDDVV